MIVKRRKALIMEKFHGSRQPVNSGEIGCSRFEPVRQILRQIFRIRGAACSTGNQGIQQFGEAVLHQQNADAGGTQQAFVSGSHQCGQSPAFKINVNMSCCLGDVQHKGDIVLCTDLSYGRSILHSTADIAAMGHDQKFCVGPDQGLCIGRVHQTFPVAGDPVEFHPGQLKQRTHDGVVLHGTDNAVITGFQKSLDNHVQTGGGTGSQDHMGGSFGKMEEFCQRFPQKQGHQSCILGSAVDTAVDGGAYGIHIGFHTAADTFRFWERCGSVVQINCTHKNPSFMLYKEYITEFRVCHGERKKRNMLEINLKQLEAFVTTAEYASFTRAAEALYLTQSTVSAHINSMEQILGIRLIQRGSRRRVQLTTEGRQAHEIAKEILHRCHSLQNLGSSIEQCQLVVGASSVPSQYLLPELMSGFLEKYPDSRYVLQRGDSEKIHQLMRKGDVRLGFVGAAQDRENHFYHAVTGDRLVLITANTEQYRKFKRAGTTGRELLHRPMILREESSGTRKAMEAYLSRCGIPVRSLDLVAQIDNTEAIKSSVSRGIGVSVVSELTIREEVESGKLLSFDLDAGGVFRNIYLAWRKDIVLTNVEHRFVEYVQSKSAKL